MKDSYFIGLPVRKNQRPSAKWCSTCGRKHARGHCLLVEVNVRTNSGKMVKRFRDIETNEAI